MGGDNTSQLTSVSYQFNYALFANALILNCYDDNFSYESSVLRAVIVGVCLNTSCNLFTMLIELHYHTCLDKLNINITPSSLY